jgi:signal transduction histidine kinase
MEATSRGRIIALDALIATVVVAFCLIVTDKVAEGGEDLNGATAALTVVGVGGGLVIRRLWSTVSLAVIVATLAIYGLADLPGGPIYLTPLFPLYTIASTGDRRRTIKVGVATLAVFVVVAIVGPDTSSHLVYLLSFTGWVAGAVFLGLSHASRRAYLVELEQRAKYLEESREEEARRRVAEERIRIARDLHDVIAHGLATINLHSGVAAHVAQRHPEQVAPTLRAIKQVSGEVLDELRATLQVLRTSDDAEDVPLAPTPGLERIDALVDGIRAAGQPVELHRHDDVVDGSIPTAVDVAAYRIVQESLSNVMRHAGRAEARIAVVRTPQFLDIEVVDDGLGAAAKDEPGQGLVGMRERAEGVGGELEAGPRPGGGYRVHARLPLASVPV